jgi:hypothetical protein
MFQSRFIAGAFVALACSTLSAATLSFTKLDGLVGGTPAATAIYRASLGDATTLDVLSITIEDNSAGLGGSPGQYSGFDLDAIKLSTEFCTTASCASSAAALPVFNFAGGVVFTPGAQRAPADPKLFGTGPTGNTLDNSVATLGLFDGNAITGPTAFGFISLGDNGKISFNLTASLAPAGVYLYIGEVGDNGEVAASGISVSSRPVTPEIPEPGTWMLSLLGLGGIAASRWRGLRR